MRKKLSYLLTVLMISVTLMTGCAKSQSSQSGTASNSSTGTTASSDTSNSAASTSGTTKTNDSVSKVKVNKKFTAKDLDVGYEDSTATHITLNGDSATISGDGAKYKDGILTISNKGTYVIAGTLNNGQIVVDAGKKDKVQIVLNGVSVTCTKNAPIYIKNSDKTFITLNKGTKNTLTDGTEYVQTDKKNVDSVIFSTSDLTVNGEGTLNITGNYKHGIVSKDNLVITGGTFNVTTVKNALSGKNCVKIKDGTFNIASTNGKGITSKNADDQTKGYVYIAGGTFHITKCTEGIEGTVIIIADGTIGITSSDDGLNAASASSTTNNNSSNNLKNNQSDNTSNSNSTATARTLKTSSNTSNNKLNTSTNATTKNKAITVSTMKTVTTNTSTGATAKAIATTKTVTTTGATKQTSATSKTDTTSGASSKSSSSTGSETAQAGQPGQGGGPGQGGFGGPGQGGPGGNGGGNGAFENDTNCYISITGGKLTINASGDGIDSNGSLSITGGDITVSGPTNDGNGGLDYNGTADITGGTIIVAGSAGMAQGFSDSSTQYSLLYNLTTSCEAGTKITLKDSDGNVVASYTPQKQYQSVVISTSKLKKNQTYTLTCGSQSAKIKLSSVVTSNGSKQTMGGPGGGFGGQN